MADINTIRPGPFSLAEKVRLSENLKRFLLPAVEADKIYKVSSIIGKEKHIYKIRILAI